MIRYYCNGFDVSNIFENEIGNVFKSKLTDIKSIT